MLDSKIYSCLGYVGTSVATTPTAAITVQPSKPTSACSTTNHVQHKEATTAKDLQLSTEYSLVGPPTEYDYVDSTGVGSYTYYISEHEIEPVTYSSANMIYETAEVHQDAQSDPPLEYEVPVDTTQAATGPNEDYSRLKYH